VHFSFSQKLTAFLKPIAYTERSNVQTSKRRGKNLAVNRGPWWWGSSHGTTGTMVNPALAISLSVCVSLCVCVNRGGVKRCCHQANVKSCARHSQHFGQRKFVVCEPLHQHQGAVNTHQMLLFLPQNAQNPFGSQILSGLTRRGSKRLTELRRPLAGFKGWGPR